MLKVHKASGTPSRRTRRGIGTKAPPPIKSTPRPSAVPKRALRAKRDSFFVVGLGASAGGLEAVRKMLGALPADTGMAFVLIQHLDPTHKSMMVDLLARDTAMSVFQAADGMSIQPDCLYVIPPQADLSVHDGLLRLSQPPVRQGAHLPFDFFLNSMADNYGKRAVCVILSGTGTDGSVGLRAVSEKGGLVIAQDPDDTAYEGMPRSAIATGAVNVIAPAVKIPEAIIRHARKHPYLGVIGRSGSTDEKTDEWLATIIGLLRSRVDHDFTHYKQATLVRRIRHRMALAGIKEIDEYVKALRKDGAELDQLAKDLLIHVTRFFRDPGAYEALAKTVVPELVRQHASDQPIRIWVAGCSTGEEAYSLAMLFVEELTAVKLTTKLQIFASDVSPEAVTYGRNGVFPESIEVDVSAERLARFFTHQSHSYRVRRELRDCIVFTVQDLLSDPPFSRLDLISCRRRGVRA